MEPDLVDVMDELFRFDSVRSEDELTASECSVCGCLVVLDECPLCNVGSLSCDCGCDNEDCELAK